MSFNNLYNYPVMIGILIIITISVILYMYFYKGNSKEQYSTSENKEIPKCKMVLYYSNSCGYCEMFMPTWNQFEEHASNNMNNVSVTKVNCESDGGKKCFENGIEGYPTVIYIH